jgi:hypothetical protein
LGKTIGRHCLGIEEFLEEKFFKRPREAPETKPRTGTFMLYIPEHSNCHFEDDFGPE